MDPVVVSTVETLRCYTIHSLQRVLVSWTRALESSVMPRRMLIRSSFTIPFLGDETKDVTDSTDEML